MKAGTKKSAGSKSVRGCLGVVPQRHGKGSRAWHVKHKDIVFTGNFSAARLRFECACTCTMYARTVRFVSIAEPLWRLFMGINVYYYILHMTHIYICIHVICMSIHMRIYNVYL